MDIHPLTALGILLCGVALAFLLFIEILKLYIKVMRWIIKGYGQRAELVQKTIRDHTNDSIREIDLATRVKILEFELMSFDIGDGMYKNATKQWLTDQKIHLINQHGFSSSELMEMGFENGLDYCKVNCEQCESAIYWWKSTSSLHEKHLAERAELEARLEKLKKKRR